MTDRPCGSAPATVQRSRGQAVLLLVLLLLAVLSVVGIALGWVTDSERLVAAREWAFNRAFYAADAGARWASAQMLRPAGFLSRSEFQTGPFGTVRFPMPSHGHGLAGPFSGDPTEEGIRVEVETPGELGIRPCVGAAGAESGWVFRRFEVRVRATENGPDARYVRRLQVDVEIGPLPADFSEKPPAEAGRAAASGDILEDTRTTGGIPGSCDSAAFRSVVLNWREP